jgi:hypothetical protein
VTYITNTPCPRNSKQKGGKAWTPSKNGRQEHAEGAMHGKSMWQEKVWKTYG